MSCDGFSCILFLTKTTIPIPCKEKEHKKFPLETSSAFEARNSEWAWHEGDTETTHLTRTLNALVTSDTHCLGILTSSVLSTQLKRMKTHRKCQHLSSRQAVLTAPPGSPDSLTKKKLQYLTAPRCSTRAGLAARAP